MSHSVKIYNTCIGCLCICKWIGKSDITMEIRNCKNAITKNK